MITVSVKAPGGLEVFFKIRVTTPLGKLMDSFCARQSLSAASVQFTFDGKRIDGNRTPRDYGMKNAATIDSSAAGRPDKLDDHIKAKMEAMEAKVGALDARVGALDARVGALDARFGALDAMVGEVRELLQRLLVCLNECAAYMVRSALGR